MKPLEVLNDDLDQVLRGELPKVTHEFKIEGLIHCGIILIQLFSGCLRVELVQIFQVAMKPW